MFMSCSSLTSLDLSNFNTGKAQYTNHMFYGCANLKTIYVSKGWDVNGVSYSYNMFSSCDRIVGEKGTTYSSSDIDKNRAVVDGENPGYLTYKDSSFESMAYAVYDSNDNSLVFFKDDIGKYYDKQVIGTKTYYYNIENQPLSQREPGWHEHSSSIQTVRFDDEIKPINTSFWFSYFTSLESPIVLTNLDTQNAVYMRNMFESYPLSVLDVSNLDTSSATRMDSMFSGCSNIETLDVSGFDTRNVTDMYMMFNGCSNVTELDVSNFSTTAVTDMAYMFENCDKLTTLNLSNFDTINVTNMYRMFYDCNLLKTIYVADKWNTDAVTESDQMFDGCNRLIGGNGTTYNLNYVDKARAKIDGGSSDPGYFTTIESYAEFDSSTGTLRIFNDDSNKYTNGQVIGTKTYWTGIDKIAGETNPKWYDKRSNVTSVVIEDAFKPKTAYHMFDGMQNLTNITGIEKLNTTSVTDMSYMFFNCSKLTSLDVTHFNTSNVENMFGMFYECEKLTSLDVTNFDTSNVTNMGGMFAFCSGLTEIKGLNFNTEDVTNMGNMFSSCRNLTEIDVTSFTVSNVANMGNMFNNCKKLISLDLTGFNTFFTTNMGNMFYGCDALTEVTLGEDFSFTGYNITDDTKKPLLPGSMWQKDNTEDIYTPEQLRDTYDSAMAGLYRKLRLVTITKQWVNDTSFDRPSDISVHLMSNNAEYDVSKASEWVKNNNVWTYTFIIPSDSEDDYYVYEDSVQGYQGDAVGTGHMKAVINDSVTITNTKEPLPAPTGINSKNKLLLAITLSLLFTMVLVTIKARRKRT